MKILCEVRKCQFWNGKNCTDTVEYVNADDGELCCRYHPDAILKEDFYFGNEDIDDILPSECEECGYMESAIRLEKELEQLKEFNDVVGNDLINANMNLEIMTELYDEQKELNCELVQVLGELHSYFDFEEPFTTDDNHFDDPSGINKVMEKAYKLLQECEGVE